MTSVWDSVFLFDALGGMPRVCTRSIYLVAFWALRVSSKLSSGSFIVNLMCNLKEKIGTSSVVAAAVASFALSTLIYLSSGLISLQLTPVSDGGDRF